MSRAFKHILLGGLIMMATTAANANDLKLTIVNPPTLYNPAPNGYSQAVVVSGANRIAYISGQGG